MENKIRKVTKAILATFLAGYIGLAPLARARAEEPVEPVTDLTIPSIPVTEEVSELPRNFFELSGTFRLDGTDGGYNGALCYANENKNGVGVRFGGTAFYENLDRGSKRSGLDGMIGVDYKGLGLGTRVGGTTLERISIKSELEQEGTVQERKKTTKDKTISGQDIALGLNYGKRFLVQFHSQPQNTDNHTNQIVDHTEPGIVVNSDVNENTTVKEENKMLRVGSSLDYSNAQLKAALGAELLMNSYNGKSITKTDGVVTTTVGPSTKVDTIHAIEELRDERSENIARLKGSFDMGNGHGYGQIGHCFSDRFSSGATKIDGSFSGKFKKGMIGLFQFVTNLYKGSKSGSVSGGFFYSDNQTNAFEELKRNTEANYEISNSIVYGDEIKEIHRTNLKDRLYASFGKGAGGIVRFIFNDGYKPGLEASAGGTYGKFSGYAEICTPDLSKPGSYSSAGARLGYKIGSKILSFFYRHRDVSYLNTDKDVKKHEIGAKINF